MKLVKMDEWIPTPAWRDKESGSELYCGDCIEILRSLPDRSVHCCVTSPPYFGLRDYGHEDQIGLEATPEEYVAKLVGVFQEVRRVLRDDGTLWLNLGDSYAANRTYQVSDSKHLTHEFGKSNASKVPKGLKPKDLMGIPWRVALALQADGWYLRSDIIWNKPNVMPESVIDRPTKAHEYIFLLTKNARYYYDAESIKVLSKYPGDTRHLRTDTRKSVVPLCTDGGSRRRTGKPTSVKRNRRTVWTVTTKPFKGAHFAVFPPDLIEPCILAGCPEGGTVLDPLSGSGTTGVVAMQHNRRAVLCELNQDYVELASARLTEAGSKRKGKNSMNLVKDNKTGLYFRPQKLDEWIIRERTTYRKLLDGIAPGFLAFDVGANIGSFAFFCLEYGADNVVCLEPEEDNYKILCKNFKGNEKIQPFKVAAAGTRGEIPFYINDKKNTGNHSMVEIKGRRKVMVESIDFGQWVALIEPDVLKIDIEGGEYLLDFSDLEEHVERVAIELHLGRKEWRNEKAPELIQTIESMGFKPIRRPKITDSNWYTLGIWAKK